MKKIIALILLCTAYIFIDFGNEKTVEIDKKILSNSEKNKPIGVIKKIKGTGLRNSNQVSPLDNVFLNDYLETKKKSFMRIKFIDDTSVSLSPNSSMKVGLFIFEKKDRRSISIKLLQGMMRSKFVHKNKKGKLNIITRHVALGVRGTEFITKVHNDYTEVLLLEGEIKAKTVDKEVIIKPKEYYRIYQKGKSFKFEKKKVSKRIIENILKRKWDNKFQIEEDILNLQKEDSTIFTSHNVKAVKKINSIKQLKKDANSTKESIKNKNIDSTDSNRKKISSLKKLYIKKITKDKPKSLNSINKIVNKLEKEGLTRKEALEVISSSLPKKLKLNYIEQLENRYSSFRTDESVRDEIAKDLRMLSLEDVKKINSLRENGEAIPLREGKDILFFENYPKIKNQLPKDSHGEIIAISSENYEIQREKSLTYNDEGDSIDVIYDKNGDPIMIPVIDEHGTVFQVPLSENDTRIILQDSPDGFRGVPVKDGTIDETRLLSNSENTEEESSRFPSSISNSDPEKEELLDSQDSSSEPLINIEVGETLNDDAIIDIEAGESSNSNNDTILDIGIK